MDAGSSDNGSMVVIEHCVTFAWHVSCHLVKFDKGL